MKKKAYLIMIVFLGALFLVFILLPVEWKQAAKSGVTSTSQEAVQQPRETPPLAQQNLQPLLQPTRYTNKQFRFSFDKPEGYTVGSFAQDGSQIFLVQSNKEVTESFQVVVTPLEQPIVLTPQFIQTDLPGTVVKKSFAIEVDGARGIMFESDNPSFGGASFEIWFTKGGYAYQATSYASFSEKLKQIIGTWKFN